MKFNWFSKKKVENSADIENTSVILPKSKIEKTIEQLLTEKTGEIGEKVSLRRFVRYELGEGIEKVCKDFAEEVKEQMGE